MPFNRILAGYYRRNQGTMKDKQALYDQAMALLESCNDILKDDPQLATINVKLTGVVKDLNDILIKELTGIKSEDTK